MDQRNQRVSDMSNRKRGRLQQSPAAQLIMLINNIHTQQNRYGKKKNDKETRTEDNYMAEI